MKDYFAYLPLAEETLLWGAGVTSTGFLGTPPGVPYPRKNLGHPPDHIFTWNRGRVLDSWQIVHVHEGGGEFESQNSRRCRVKEGTTFILFPGEWHRYRPDRKTGWVESWVEFEGGVPDRLRDSGSLDVAKAVFPGRKPPEFIETLNRIHLQAKGMPFGFAAHLATSALQLLSLLVQQDGRATIPDSPAKSVVRRAREELEKSSDQPVCIGALARTLGVAESHFRRIFKSETGVSPKHYSRTIRHRRVRALLRSTALSVTEIAARTGYHSAFHLSAEFKKETGQPPSIWRRFQRQELQYSEEIN
ncbi:MAG: AraC family transcriptional regulator [Terrimicrobiaceae bacterium]